MTPDNDDVDEEMQLHTDKRSSRSCSSPAAAQHFEAPSCMVTDPNIVHALNSCMLYACTVSVYACHS
jgi:hypothetical protein